MARGWREPLSLASTLKPKTDLGLPVKRKFKVPLRGT